MTSTNKLTRLQASAYDLLDNKNTLSLFSEVSELLSDSGDRAKQTLNENDKGFESLFKIYLFLNLAYNSTSESCILWFKNNGMDIDAE